MQQPLKHTLAIRLCSIYTRNGGGGGGYVVFIAHWWPLWMFITTKRQKRQRSMKMNLQTTMNVSNSSSQVQIDSCFIFLVIVCLFIFNQFSFLPPLSFFLNHQIFVTNSVKTDEPAVCFLIGKSCPLLKLFSFPRQSTSIPLPQHTAFQ